MNSTLPNFSHLYVEGEVRDHPFTRRLRERFAKARVVEIEGYQEVFNRAYQSWRVQKKSPKLILAGKREGLIYRCSEIAPSFGHQNFFYNTLVMNCIYDCDYCYLQGMFPSANLVVFVNQEDFEASVDQELTCSSPLYLCISYDTDLMAMEPIFGLCSRWIEFTRRRPQLEIELRTKSSNFKPLAQLAPVDNVILAWTLSPEVVRTRFEGLTPSLAQRLKAAHQAAEAGWRVRLCFDPILRVKDWREAYQETIEQVQARFLPSQIRDTSVGVFRMNRDYWQRIKKQRDDTPVIHYPYEVTDQVASYPEPQSQEMTTFVAERLAEWLGAEKVTTVGVPA